jgi:hypothetical protein
MKLKRALEEVQVAFCESTKRQDDYSACVGRSTVVGGALRRQTQKLPRGDVLATGIHASGDPASAGRLFAGRGRAKSTCRLNKTDGGIIADLVGSSVHRLLYYGDKFGSGGSRTRWIQDEVPGGRDRRGAGSRSCISPCIVRQRNSST